MFRMHKKTNFEYEIEFHCIFAEHFANTLPAIEWKIHVFRFCFTVCRPKKPHWCRNSQPKWIQTTIETDENETIGITNEWDEVRQNETFDERWFERLARESLNWFQLKWPLFNQFSSNWPKFKFELCQMPFKNASEKNELWQKWNRIMKFASFSLSNGIFSRSNRIWKSSKNVNRHESGELAFLVTFALISVTLLENWFVFASFFVSSIGLKFVFLLLPATKKDDNHKWKKRRNDSFMLTLFSIAVWSMNSSLVFPFLFSSRLFCALRQIASCSRA